MSTFSLGPKRLELDGDSAQCVQPPVACQQIYQVLAGPIQALTDKIDKHRRYLFTRCSRIVEKRIHVGVGGKYRQ